MPNNKQIYNKSIKWSLDVKDKCEGRRQYN